MRIEDLQGLYIAWNVDIDLVLFPIQLMLNLQRDSRLEVGQYEKSKIGYTHSLQG